MTRQYFLCRRLRRPLFRKCLGLLQSNHCNTYHFNFISSTILRSFVTQLLWGYCKLLQFNDFESRHSSPQQIIIIAFTVRQISRIATYTTMLREKRQNQRCNFIIQIHKFTIKIDTISINLLFECVKIVESVISIPTCFLSCIKRYFL